MGSGRVKVARARTKKQRAHFVANTSAVGVCITHLHTHFCVRASELGEGVIKGKRGRRERIFHLFLSCTLGSLACCALSLYFYKGSLFVFQLHQSNSDTPKEHIQICSGCSILTSFARNSATAVRKYFQVVHAARQIGLMSAKRL